MDDSGNETKKQPVYYCQRCKNHGHMAPRRAHQRQCPYKHCTCGLCRLIDHRRIVMRTRNQIHVSEGIPPYTRFADCGTIEETTVKKTRKPRCFLCSGHGKYEVLKDHKRRGCPYEQCTCGACMLGRQYRRLMAIQTKQRRDQTRDEYIQIVEINDHGAVVTPPMTQTHDNKPTKKGFLIEDILAQDNPKEKDGNISRQNTFVTSITSNLPQSTFALLPPLTLFSQSLCESEIINGLKTFKNLQTEDTGRL